MTPHNKAEKDSIAKIVIMPGDPLRAKYITEKYLTDYKLVNDVRGIYAYTGYYKNKRLTVMASGMGCPSMGIYSHELFSEYDVDLIIRVGSSGALKESIHVRDVVLAKKVVSDSNFGLVQGYNSRTITGDETINELIANKAKELGIKLIEDTVYTTDVFYNDNEYLDYVKEENPGCVEMESYALFYNAKKLGKKACAIFTISDSLVTHEELSSEERQNSFDEMIYLALETVGELNV